EAPGFVQIQGAEAATFATASVNAWIIGHADAARKCSRAALEGTQRSRYDVAFAQMQASAMHLLLGEFTRAEALAAKASSQCQQHGFTELTAWSLPPLGLARAKLGGTSEGIALLRQAVTQARDAGPLLNLTWALTCLAEAQKLDGVIADALGTIEDALQANP